MVEIIWKVLAAMILICVISIGIWAMIQIYNEFGKRYKLIKVKEIKEFIKLNPDLNKLDIIDSGRFTEKEKRDYEEANTKSNTMPKGICEANMVDAFEPLPKSINNLINHNNITSPSHYKLEGLNIESIEVIKSVLGEDKFKGFCIGNALKYLIRAEKKSGLEDYKKARQYLDWIIGVED